MDALSGPLDAPGLVSRRDRASRDPRSRAGNLLGALAVALTDGLGGSLDRASGHSGETASALRSMSTFLGGTTVSTLAGVLDLTPSGAVRLVDRLAVEGLVRRQRGVDGRERRVLLTPAGRRMAHRVGATRHAYLRRLVDQLPAGDLLPFEATVARLLGGLGKRDPGAARACRLCDTAVCESTGPCPLRAAAARGSADAPPTKIGTDLSSGRLPASGARRFSPRRPPSEP